MRYPPISDLVAELGYAPVPTAVVLQSSTLFDLFEIDNCLPPVFHPFHLSFHLPFRLLFLSCRVDALDNMELTNSDGFPDTSAVELTGTYTVNDEPWARGPTDQSTSTANYNGYYLGDKLSSALWKRGPTSYSTPTTGSDITMGSRLYKDGPKTTIKIVVVY